MSFLTGLFTARSGMEAFTTQISHVSDNIANATTVGFKKIETRFQDMVQVTGNRADLNSFGRGLSSFSSLSNMDAVRAKAYFNNRSQGVIAQSTSPTNFAVSGQGFIPVARATLNDPTNAKISFDTTSYFTRAGDFEPVIDPANASGNTRYLRNSNGYYLMGVPYGSSASSTTPSVINVDTSALAATPTTTVNYVANIPAGAAVGATLSGDTPVIDSTGAQVALAMSWNKTAANAWTVTTTIGGVATVPATTNVTFNTNGTLASPASTALTAGANSITVNFGTVGSSTNTMTQYGGSTINVSSVTQNGVPAQTARNIGIDSNGNVYVAYSSGSVVNKFTVPLAMCFEPNRLERFDGTVFTQTDDTGAASRVSSGDITYTNANANGAGGIKPQSTEGSTVDIADQFTNMVVAQRAYSFNAQTFRANDEMWKVASDLR